MSIIINGIELPTNGDNITYNGVSVERVVYGGITVWEKIANFYVWENGIPYPSHQPFLYGTTHDRIKFGIKSGLYGISSDVDNDIAGGLQIPDIATRGRTHLQMQYITNLDGGSGVRTFYTRIYGIKEDGTEDPIFQRTPYDYHGHGILGNPGGDTTIDMSTYDYETIRIRAHLSTGKGSDDRNATGTVWYCIHHIYLYDE